MLGVGLSRLRFMGDRAVFRVMQRRCDECLFGPNKIVSDARKAEVLEAADQNYFVCHKASLAGHDDVCCAGFYERDPYHSLVMRLAAMLDLVERVREGDLRKAGPR